MPVIANQRWQGPRDSPLVLSQLDVLHMDPRSSWCLEKPSHIKIKDSSCRTERGAMLSSVLQMLHSTVQYWQIGARGGETGGRWNGVVDDITDSG